MPRTRPPYPQEFRLGAIPLAQLGDKPQRKLARDSRISDVTLRSWLKEQKASRGERPGGLSGEEREELGRLRDENAKLRMEREILRKAAVFFEREDDGRYASATRSSIGPASSSEPVDLAVELDLRGHRFDPSLFGACRAGVWPN